MTRVDDPPLLCALPLIPFVELIEAADEDDEDGAGEADRESVACAMPGVEATVYMLGIAGVPWGELLAATSGLVVVILAVDAVRTFSINAWICKLSER